MTTIRPNIIIDSYSLIKHEAEEGGYWGEVVELPGCVSQGETELELIQNIREAIAAVLEAQDDELPTVFYASDPGDDKETLKFYNDEPQTWTGAVS